MRTRQPYRDKLKILLDVSNCTIEKEIKDAAGADTSTLAAKKILFF